jgi:TonB-linked SusC/RagA family outer membrane protein
MKTNHPRFVCCLLLLIAAVLTQPSAAQNRTVTGSIAAADQRLKLGGASILVQQSGAQTIANEQGYFSIQVPSGLVTLVCSFAGYETRRLSFITDTLSRELEIWLQPESRSLDTAIVTTGYQQLPRERMSGSVLLVNQETLQKQVGSNILQRLNGVTGSLIFDRNTNRPALTIRGLSSINGPKDPLIVVDNFPYEGNISNINPNDIESVSILRDAAAASIWGTRAGNGVVVITTKKGRLQQPLRMEMLANITSESKPDAYYQQTIAPADFIALEKQLFSKGFYDADISNPQQPPLSPAVEQMLAHRQGLINDALLARRLDSLGQTDWREQQDRYWYSRSWKQQYALALQMGSGRHSFRLSGGYDDERNELGSQFRRASWRGHHQVQAGKKWDIQLLYAATGTQTKAGRPASGLLSASGKLNYPYLALTDAAGKAAASPRQYRMSYTDTAGKGALLPWGYFPLTDHKARQTEDRVLDLLGQVQLRYKPLRWLALEGIYMYQQQQSRRVDIQGQDTYFTRNTINQFSQLNRTTGAVTYVVPLGSIRQNSDQLRMAHQLRLTTQVQQQWDLWTLSALAGAEWRGAATDQANWMHYGYNNSLRTIGRVDYVTRYPNFVTGSLQNIPNNDSYGATWQRFQSLFANAGLTYQKRYTLTGSVRKDASNLFGVASNERSVPLWSSGVVWHISNETFFKDRYLRLLEARLSYGYNGNADPTRSAVTTITYLPPIITPYARAQINQVGNPELAWERVGTLNAGLKAISASGRIDVNVEWYQKNGKDLFGPVVIDYTTGLASQTITRNVAAMRGNGWDIQLNTLNTQGAIAWRSTLNFSIAKTTVTDYYNASKQASLFINYGQSINAVEGKPVYSIFSYPYAGLDRQTGDPIGYLGKVQSKDYAAIMGPATQLEDILYHGSATPTHFGNLLNGLTWKGITLEFNITYRFGYYFRKQGIHYSNLFTLWNGDAEYARRWQQPGDEAYTNVPALGYPINTNRDVFYNSSEVLVQKADHIRLQFINLQYRTTGKGRGPGAKWVCDWFFNAANLGILWKANKVGYDPDVPDGSLPPGLLLSAGVRAQW